MRRGRLYAFAAIKKFCFEVFVKIKLIISLFTSGRLKTVEKLNFMEIKTRGILSTVKQRKNLKCEKIVHSTYKNAIKCIQQKFSAKM